MGKRGNNTLDVADILTDVMRGMSILEKSKFERALVRHIPEAIEAAAQEARTPTKSDQKPKADNGR